MSRAQFVQNIDWRLRQLTDERLALEEIILARGDKSILQEWAVHKLLYQLGLFRSHTHSVDLNYPLAWWEKAGYSILGGFAIYIYR